MSDKHHRAHKGASAAQASPRRYAPLRTVLNTFGDYEELECGHTQSIRRDMIGNTYTSRRRCLACLVDACRAAGHPIDIERGTSPSCKCGAADGAVIHLNWFHGLADVAWEEAGLAALETAHSGNPPTREHWHWSGQPWSVRTRPEASRDARGRMVG